MVVIFPLSFAVGGDKSFSRVFSSCLDFHIK